MKSKTIKIGRHYSIDRSELQAFKDIQCLSLNDAEKEFKKKATDKGWNVIKNGWPDFLIYKDNEIRFIEVKNGKDKLREDQIKMLKTLTKYGLKCYTWHPKTGFKKFREAV